MSSAGKGSDKDGDSMYRRPWDTREDEKLRALVTEHGTQQWALIASEMDGRNGKQCRERWHNQLDTNLSKDGWSEEEDRILLEGQNQHGNKWAEIAKMLPGRTDNSVKKPQSTAQGALQGGPPRDSPWSGFGSLWEYLGDYLGDNNMDEEERRLDEEEQRMRGGKRGAEDEDARSESDGSELGREPFTEDEMLSELDEMLDAFGSDVAGDDGAAALAPPRPPSPRQHKLSDLSVRELNEC